MDDKKSTSNILGRGSISLSFDKSIKTAIEKPQPNEITGNDKRLSKAEIYDLYKQEIDELIKEDRKKISAEYDLKLKKEISSRERELNDSTKAKHENIDAQITKLKDLMTSISDDFNGFCNNEIVQLDTLIISLVMEVLYKITGSASNYQNLIREMLNDALVKKINDFKRLEIKVSKEDYLLFKKHFSDESWIDSIKVDDRLSIGQIVLDDGFSLFECGLLDQLNSMQTEFISALRNNYE